MDVNNLKHIVGEAKSAEPAIIRFFDSVNPDSARCFISEFLWLQDYIKPSKIIVLINSEGGSVLSGMSIYSVIQACPVEVDCVIEGIAASMGSVIWAAGDNSYMHDYSLLMIHNPYSKKCAVDPSQEKTIEAFKLQLETIYRKRFGLNKSKVNKIMNGEDGADGTFFTAQEAADAGILPPANIIATSHQIRDKVKGDLQLDSDPSAIREFMNSISAAVDENKLLQLAAPINIQNELEQESNTTMNENQLFYSQVCAQLGYDGNSPVANVTTRVATLIEAEAHLKDISAKYSELKIKHKGKEAEVANLTTQLTECQASLDTYKAAEKEALAAEIAGMVKEALALGKIQAADGPVWIEMAEANFSLAKATLESIPAREKLTEEIGKDGENLANAQNGMTDVEKAVQAKIKEVLPGDVVLATF